MCAQQAKLPASAHAAPGDLQNALAGGGIKGQEIKTQLLNPGIQTEACDPGQYSVNSVGGGAAHQPHHQPDGLTA